MEEECRKINLEDKYKEALRKAKEVREYVYKRNDGCEPSIAECLAYDMQYVEQYVENLIARYKELEEKNKTLETLLQGNLYQMYLYYKELAGRYQANSISKDKVKEKIEEYKRKMEKDVNYLSKDYFNYRHKIYALQELLED